MPQLRRDDETECFYSLEKHFEYVIQLDELHEWVTAFRYDIVVRANVMCHHVSGGVADPSVKRQKFLDAAKAKTDSFKDGWIRRHDNPYVKGGEKERFNPLTGARYERLQTHDANETEEATTFNAPTARPREAYASRRGRGSFHRNQDGRSWGNRGDRQPSPYQRKPKDKQQTVPTQSTSKEKMP